MMRIVCVGDLHVGSVYALCPPEVSCKGGGKWIANDGQKRLYETWQYCVEKTGWKKPDVLVVNGDAVDGQGSKRAGMEQWDTDLNVQVQAAADLLRMWEAKRIYVVRGSGYHSENNGVAVEENVGVALEAERWPDGSGERSGWELFLTAEGVTFHFAHTVGVGTGWYLTTPIAREMFFASLTELERAFKKDMREQVKNRIRCVVRSHTHYYVHVAFPHEEGWIVPGWQGKTPYTIRKSALGMRPKIGFVAWEVNGENSRFERFMWRSEQLLPSPHAIIGRRRSA